MSQELRFDGRVAVVTGAGRGLGRAHALTLARRGAAVVVNDLGGALDGTATGEDPAASVAAEIVEAGGTAVADTHSVGEAAGAEAIVETALEEFGRVDIVVNNAGNTGGHPTFGEITEDAAMAVIRTHLLGTLHVTQAAWSPMVRQGYGRVVNTSSGVGYFGHPRATTYAAAKMGVAGLSRALAIEAAEHGITVNVLAPIARTRMAGGVFGDLDAHLDPELVSAVVTYLAHESCDLNGRALTAGAGRVGELFVAATPGHFEPGLTPESVRDQLARVLDRADHQVPVDAMAEVAMTAAFHDIVL